MNTNENLNKQFIEQLRALIRLEIGNIESTIIKRREVIIKKVYNSNNHNKRMVDVIFANDLSQTISIKKIPVNIPYSIQVGDHAELFYFEKPSNGWIGTLITYTADDYNPVNTTSADSLMLGGKPPSDYVLTNDVRMINSRPASDVSAWAKKEILDILDIPLLPISKIDDLINVLSDKASLLDGLIVESQIPSKYDNVLTYSSISDFPSSGVVGKLYIAKDSKRIYRWNEEEYIQLCDNATKVDGKVVKYYSVSQFALITPISGVHYVIYED